jgi:hypothetical protein
MYLLDYKILTPCSLAWQVPALDQILDLGSKLSLKESTQMMLYGIKSWTKISLTGDEKC